MTELKEQTGANFWNPETEGEKLEGTVSEINEGDFGKQYTIKTEDGEFVTPSHKVLQSRMRKAEVGDQCSIEYTGSEAPSVKGHSPTKLYKVMLPR